MLRAAVVGCGHLGRIHCRILAGLPGVTLAAVVDRDGGRAGAMAEAFGARPLTEAAGLPGLVDLAVVAVPTRDHHAVASLLVDQGISVLVEKPMCRTLEEARDLVARAEARGVALMPGHVERWNPVVLALDPLGLDPRFIEAHRVSPFTFRSADVSVVLDMMIHDLDIVLHLVKSPVAEIRASGVSLLGAGEDIASARIEFRNGAVASVTASRMALKRERTLRIFSSAAYATLDGIARKGRVYRKGPALLGGLDPSSVDISTVTDPVEFMLRDLIRVEDLVIEDREPLAAEDQAFVDAVAGRRTPPVTGEDGIRAMDVALRIEAEMRRTGDRAGGDR